MANDHPFQGNDRTWLLEQKEAQQQEQRTQDELQHYEALGTGLAMFCLSFWETLRAAEPAYEARFTRDETLRLLEAAVRGR